MTRLWNNPRTAFPFGNRLAEQSELFREVRHHTANSRAYNRDRINNRSRGGAVEVFDHVIIQANDPVPLTHRYDPQWVVTRVRGNVISVIHQTTGMNRVLNRDKIKVVPADMAWDDINPRPTRAHIRQRQAAAGLPITKAHEDTQVSQSIDNANNQIIPSTLPSADPPVRKSRAEKRVSAEVPHTQPVIKLRRLSPEQWTVVEDMDVSCLFL